MKASNNATDSDHADDFVLKISTVVDYIIVRVTNPSLSTFRLTITHTKQL